VHAGGGAAKRQFKLADREGARFVAVVGEDEVEKSGVMLKNLETGQQDFYHLNPATLFPWKGEKGRLSNELDAQNTKQDSHLFHE